jgi:hypothetical protein
MLDIFHGSSPKISSDPSIVFFCATIRQIRVVAGTRKTDAFFSLHIQQFLGVENSSIERYFILLYVPEAIHWACFFLFFSLAFQRNNREVSAKSFCK